MIEDATDEMDGLWVIVALFLSLPAWTAPLAAPEPMPSAEAKERLSRFRLPKDRAETEAEAEAEAEAGTEAGTEAGAEAGEVHSCVADGDVGVLGDRGDRGDASSESSRLVTKVTRVSGASPSR